MSGGGAGGAACGAEQGGSYLLKVGTAHPRLAAGVACTWHGYSTGGWRAHRVHVQSTNHQMAALPGAAHLHTCVCIELAGLMWQASLYMCTYWMPHLCYALGFVPSWLQVRRGAGALRNSSCCEVLLEPKLLPHTRDIE